MTYSVHQHWDPLKVCAVGRSYPPEFYSYIQNSKIRNVMERVAMETEEDYQKLIKLLESFNVEIVRTEIGTDINQHLNVVTGKYLPPPMTPRDYTAMIGNIFYMPETDFEKKYDLLKGTDYPSRYPTNHEEFNSLPEFIKQELKDFGWEFYNAPSPTRPIKTLLEKQGNKILYNKNINSAMTTRIGKDLYFGTHTYDQDQRKLKTRVEKLFPDYRCHVVNTGGHSDSTFCPVKPGLIVSLYDVPSYSTTFPDWEVVYLPGQSWSAVKPFLELKQKNYGKWWVPGEELNDDFTDFVETWLEHWVGYVEETVFDVNMLVIDEKNVVCNNYNEKVFAAFDRHGITPHVVNFRHRYFWDGGLHCITSDLHREGVKKDYFPERG
jgi:N-dimethylarginine dimethylaminohydrolase